MRVMAPFSTSFFFLQNACVRVKMAPGRVFCHIDKFLVSFYVLFVPKGNLLDFN